MPSLFEEEINELELLGAPENLIQQKINEKKRELQLYNAPEDIIKETLGIRYQEDVEIDPDIVEPIQNFWQKQAKSVGKGFKKIKTELVGEDAEWQKYWERGLGKTNINLALQYHSGGNLGYDWKNASEAEPIDTGILERYFESIVGLGGDLPTFAVGGTIAGFASGGNPFATGFGAGFVNDTIKGMYYEALNQGKVENYSEWWDIFLKHGVKEGVKGGLTVGSIAAAPGLLPKLKLKGTAINKFMSQYIALTGVGSAIEQEMPTKEHLINNALILGTFGVTGKGFEMLKDRSVKRKQDLYSFVEEIIESPLMREDVRSKNIKNFRNDKEIDARKIKELNEEYATLERLEIKENVELLIERQKIEKEIIKETTNEVKAKELETRYEEINKQLEISKDQVVPENLQQIRTKKEKIEQALEKLDEPIGKIKTVKKSELKTDFESANKVLESVKLGDVKVENKGNFLDQIKYQGIDKLYPVLKLVRKAEKAGYTTKQFILDAYKQLRIQPGMVGYANFFIEKATMNLKAQKNGIPLMGKKGVLRNIRTKKEYAEFTAYAASRRTVELIERGIETGIGLKDAKATIKQFDAKYKQTFKELTEFQQRTLKYLQEAGIISEKTFNEILELNKDFLPVHRVADPSVKGNNMSAQTQSNPIRRIKGIEGVKKTIEKFKTEIKTLEKQQKQATTPTKKNELALAIEAKKQQIAKEEGKLSILDPIESVHLNTMYFIQLAEKNLALVKLIEMVEANPKLFPEIQKINQVKRFDVSKKEIETMTGKKFNEDVAETMSVFRRNGQVLENGKQIAIYRNGKREVWEVGKDIAESVLFMNRASMNSFLRYASIPTRMLRAGATLDPAFTIKNLNRDAFSGSVLSKYWENIPYITSMQGVFHYVAGRYGPDIAPLKKSKRIYENFVRSGAMQSMLNSLDRNYFRDSKVINELTNVRRVQNYVNPKNWLEFLRAVSESAESAVRLGDFMIGLEKTSKLRGMTKKEKLQYLGFESRNLTIDFAKIGNQVQAVNMLSAFFNAGIQGEARLIEGFQKNPKMVSAKIAAYITLPSILLWLKNHDSEVYKEVPQYQKDLFWIVISGENTEDQVIWRIPKPFTLGILFGSIPERMLDYYSGEDPEGIKQTLKDLAGNTAGLIVPDFNAIQPLVENYANRNFFFNRPIVPRALEGEIPEYQFNEYTTGIARLLGKATNYSPMKIDNIIKGWTGGLGNYAMSALDMSLRKAGLIPTVSKPLTGELIKDLADIPIIKALVIRNKSLSSESINRFFKQYSKIKPQWTTYNRLLSDSIGEGILEAQKRFPPEEQEILIQKWSEIESTITFIQDQIRMITDIRRNPNIESAEKRQIIDQYYTNVVNASKDSMKQLRFIEEGIDND
jgi:hypothetical protein